MAQTRQLRWRFRVIPCPIALAATRTGVASLTGYQSGPAPVTAQPPDHALPSPPRAFRYLPIPPRNGAPALPKILERLWRRRTGCLPICECAGAISPPRHCPTTLAVAGGATGGLQSGRLLPVKW